PGPPAAEIGKAVLVERPGPVQVINELCDRLEADRGTRLEGKRIKVILRREIPECRKEARIQGESMGHDLPHDRTLPRNDPDVEFRMSESAHAVPPHDRMHGMEMTV